MDYIDDFLEFLDEVVPTLPPAPSSPVPVDLRDWNIEMYYEAMGLDNLEENENDDQ